MKTAATGDFVRGIRIGTGILAALAVGWAGVSFAAAAWGALPNAGTTLSSAAWNDIVGQVNGLAGTISVNSGLIWIGTQNVPSISWWTPGTWHRTFEITGLWVDASTSDGLLLLTNNRPTAAQNNQHGAVLFWAKNDWGWLHAAIASYARGSGWANGFGGDLRFYTKDDNVMPHAERMILTESGSLGIGTTSPQSKFQVVWNYLQIPNYSGAAPLASDCDQASEAGRMAIYTPNTGAPATSYLYICPQGGGWVAK